MPWILLCLVTCAVAEQVPFLVQQFTQCGFGCRDGQGTINFRHKLFPWPIASAPFPVAYVNIGPSKRARQPYSRLTLPATITVRPLISKVFTVLQA
jgi:hypothetical protein